MSRAAAVLVGAIVLAGIGLIVWNRYGPQEPTAPAAARAVQEEEIVAAPPVPVDAEPEYRIPDADPAQARAAPLPSLADSDAEVRSQLEALAGCEPLEALLVPRDLIRRWVAFINRLDGDGVPLSQRPMRHVAGTPPVNRDGQRLWLDDSNALRYAAYMRVVQAVDAQRLVDFYFRWYPLFQQAYDELGVGGYFNSRLLRVIDHLLATPEVQGPIELQRPKVLYRYADAQLEALSFGQKLLIRIGSDNAAQLKAKLREIRMQIRTRLRGAG